MLKTIDVVAAIITQNGKILLARRSASSDQPGLWEFPGGKVEPHETQPQALIRELEEELGIRATPADWVASHQQAVSGRIIHLHAWRVPRFTGIPRLTASHSELVWCTPAQATEYNLAPADIPLLAAFIQHHQTD